MLSCYDLHFMVAILNGCNKPARIKWKLGIILQNGNIIISEEKLKLILILIVIRLKRGKYDIDNDDYDDYGDYNGEM